DLSFVESIPVRLPDIDAEYLQHVDDAWLDNAYEERLERTGDDLSPIASAKKLTEMLFGKREASAPSVNGIPTAVAAVRARTVEDIAPDFKEESDTPLPVLSKDPTNEELLKYAHAHPTVKAALRIFRAEIVDVRK